MTDSQLQAMQALHDQFERRLSSLGTRQREVFELAASGVMLIEVAPILKISLRTAKEHMRVASLKMSDYGAREARLEYLRHDARKLRILIERAKRSQDLAILDAA